MIEVKGISKTYRLGSKQQAELGLSQPVFHAVNDVTFTCRPGVIHSLLGPNGAGKTTMLRMIATLLRPSAGSILVHGHDVQQESREVREKIGFLTGSTNLYERLTPVETVRYFGELNGMDRQRLHQRQEMLFDQLGIQDFRNKRIGQLSTGMKQKVSIARTMIHDPEVVVFDEPTSGLDVISAASIIQLIRQCKAEGKTVIFSSHIMSEVDLLCDELAIINKGRLIHQGTMEAFRRSAAGASLTEAFIRTVTAA